MNECTRFKYKMCKQEAFFYTKKGRDSILLEWIKYSKKMISENYFQDYTRKVKMRESKNDLKERTALT